MVALVALMMVLRVVLLGALAAVIVYVAVEVVRRLLGPGPDPMS